MLLYHCGKHLLSEKETIPPYPKLTPFWYRDVKGYGEISE